MQVQGVMKHGARGKKQTLKSASTDLGTTDVGRLEMHNHAKTQYDINNICFIIIIIVMKSFL